MQNLLLEQNEILTDLTEVMTRKIGVRINLYQMIDIMEDRDDINARHRIIPGLVPLYNSIE